MHNSVGVLPRDFTDLGTASCRRRVAVVYNRTPLPMRRADQMTVAHLISFLHARGHSVDLFALRTGAEVGPAEEAWLRDHTNALYFEKHTVWDAARGLLGGAVKGLPLQVGMFQNARLARALRTRISAGEYDYVYVYYFRSAEAAKGLGVDLPTGKSGSRTPSFLALQLSQTLNTRRIRDNAPNIFNKLLYEFESRLVSRYETQIWRYFTRTILIGIDDLKAINSEASSLGRPVISDPIFSAHGTDVERFSVRDDAAVPGRVVFSGVMRTPTNVQAVQWFVERVWPEVKREASDATFVIVGREPTKEVKSLASSDMSIEVTGTVEDPSLLIASAAVCVNPMQAGGGMQNKLIEYLAAAKPVVATSVANEGIGAPSEALRVADDPHEFAQAVIGLLKDPLSGAAMAAEGRRFVMENWTWEHHFMKFEASIEQAIAAVSAVGAD